MSKFEIDNPSCTEGMTEPHLWIIHIFELCFSILAITGNCIVTVLSREAAPIAITQRKIMVAWSLNFALLGCFQLARNTFITISMYNPCINLVSTISCKLQEFPLLFCYIHCSLLVVMVALQSKIKKKEARKRLPWTTLFGIWQSILVVIAVGLTLLFTAFDIDPNPENMEKCSILLAMRSKDLGFWLLTLLIITNSLAIGVSYFSTRISEHPSSHSTIIAVTVKDVLIVETLMWKVSILCTGITFVYNHVIIDPPKEIINLLLEIFFIFMPLVISSIHPTLLIWYVFPMRDSAVRIFPLLRCVLPEYSLVPPPIPSKTKEVNLPTNSLKSQI